MRHLPLAALLAWAALIFTLSSIPNPPDAGGSGWQYEAAHVVEYAIFGWLALRMLRGYRPAAPIPVLALVAWSLAVVYGMSDEFHQSFVPNRNANWLDVGFDAIGAAIGIFLARLLIRGPAVKRAK